MKRLSRVGDFICSGTNWTTARTPNTQKKKGVGEGMGNLYSETEGRPAWMRVARKTENSQLKHNWVEISRYILHTPLLTLSHSRCDCTQPASSQPATTSDDGASAG